MVCGLEGELGRLLVTGYVCIGREFSFPLYDLGELFFCVFRVFNPSLYFSTHIDQLVGRTVGLGEFQSVKLCFSSPASAVNEIKKAVTNLFVEFH